MSINLKQLKESLIRKTIKYQDEEITIMNPTFEQKELIFQKIQSYILKVDRDNTEIVITDIELIRYIFNELVFGIDFDGLENDEVQDIFDNPTQTLREILDEISLISQEICEEAMNGFNSQLDSIEKTLESYALINKAESFSNKHMSSHKKKTEPKTKPKPNKLRIKKVDGDATI